MSRYERRIAADGTTTWHTPLGRVWAPMVTLSARSLRQRFNGCDPDYIATTCHAACCKAPTHPTGCRVAITTKDEAGVRARGATVTDGYLDPRPGTRGCPFQDRDTWLCSLHHTPDKPFGCIASPFVLTVRDTLVVRNRYRMLRCYDDGKRQPAYLAFRASLELLFGDTAAGIVAHMDAGGGDIEVAMLLDSYTLLAENAHTRSE